MKPDPVRTLTRGEQEAETESARLIELIDDALASVAIPAAGDALDSAADRIERAARDLSAALRELARQRQAAVDNNE